MNTQNKRQSLAEAAVKSLGPDLGPSHLQPHPAGLCACALCASGSLILQLPGLSPVVPLAAHALGPVVSILTWSWSGMVS